MAGGQAAPPVASWYSYACFKLCNASASLCTEAFEVRAFGCLSTRVSGKNARVLPLLGCCAGPLALATRKGWPMHVDDPLHKASQVN